jgi:hypothetical protein
LTVNVSVHSGTPDFVTPTAQRIILDTDQHEIEVATTSVNTKVSIQLETTAGATVEKAGMLVTGQFKAGEGFHEARFGFDGMKTGDGTYSIALP